MLNIAIYGGSFDPIHWGHIRTALAVQATFHFDRLLFLPCKQPLLKAASRASTSQRLSMLSLALESFPEFGIDSREIERDSPSYMVETLRSIRSEYDAPLSLSLILGMDAFADLERWYQYQELFTLGHLLVLQRPNYGLELLSEHLQQILNQRESTVTASIRHREAGLIYRLDAGQFPLASSQIREAIRQGENCTLALPEAVTAFIEQQGLYR